jgi:hypothetical protein
MMRCVSAEEHEAGAPLDEGAERPVMPESLWQRLRADPTRAPEHLALAAADIHGPAAARWVAEKQAEAGYTPRRLAELARNQHTHLSRITGAATGLGGFWTVIPDMAAIAWIQARMIFFIAAAFGFDPEDRMRPAELLVLQRLFDDPYEAREALDGVGQRVATAWAGRRMNRDNELFRSLRRMAVREATDRVAGRLIPGVASIFNAVQDSRDTRLLADRAIRFYGG